ncbi:MAG: HEAT repeat domain-containing protein [Ignavibacterium sp.]|nr:MAG: HEAT repeat domain-containing protein [Ignavibacterium sp.]
MLFTKKEKRKFVLLVFLFLSSIICNETLAQNVSIKELTPNKYALENLEASLNSENCGVKRHAIYLAGKYRIAEAEDILLEQLKNEKLSCNRILIALVLYELGSEKALIAVGDLVKNDDSAKARRKATHIYYQYLKNDKTINAF